MKLATDRSAITSAAWAIRKETGLGWSACMTSAWRAAKLKSALRNGVVEFTYTKTDGTLRSAKGTLSSDLFSYTAKGSDRSESGLTLKYWDIEAAGWRCARIERIVSIAA